MFIFCEYLIWKSYFRSTHRKYNILYFSVQSLWLEGKLIIIFCKRRYLNCNFRCAADTGETARGKLNFRRLAHGAVLNFTSNTIELFYCRLFLFADDRYYFDDKTSVGEFVVRGWIRCFWWWWATLYCPRGWRVHRSFPCSLISQPVVKCSNSSFSTLAAMLSRRRRRFAL